MAVQNDGPAGVVALAASRGGFGALSQTLGGLPATFAAAVVVVQHLPSGYKSLLPESLGRRTRLVVKEAEEGDCLRPGCVFIAPPHRHLLVNPGGTLSLSGSAKVHHARPSADPLFSSVAASFGDKVVAVVLTGGDSDGSGGVRAVKAAGGTVIAQDERTCEDFSMPREAIATGCVDMVLALEDIAPVLVGLVGKWA